MLCGFTWSDKTLLKGMKDKLKHRSFSQSYFSENISMASDHYHPSGSTISFEGKIYNKTESIPDAEYVLNLFIEKGPGCLKELNGQFAFAIWHNNKIFLARDRFGIKPLYWINTDKGMAFASEMKALIHLSKKNIDMESLSHYLAFRCTPNHQTILKDIFKIPPGCYYYNTLIRYWNPEWKPQEYKGDLKNKLYELLSSAIESRMSEKPAVFLSGGIDSSSILALASKSNQINTFTAGFDIEGFDERKEAQQTANHFNTNHKEIILDESSLDKLPEIIYNFDEPMADPTILPVYFLSKQAAKTTDSVLVGEAGDECFGGYAQYKFMKMHKLIKTGAPFVKVIPNSILNKIFKYSSDLGEAGIERMKLFAKEKTKNKQHFQLISIFNNEEMVLELGLPGVSLNKIDDMNDMTKEEIRATMADDLMMKMDKNGMQFGLHGRFPFLDHNLFEFAANIDPNLKLKGYQSKWIFREAMKPHLPKFIFDRPKSRFFVPIHKWGVKEKAEEILKEDNFFHKSYVDKILNKYDKSKLYYARQLWAMMCFTIWKKRFID